MVFFYCFSLQAARSRLVLSEQPATASADAVTPIMMRHLYLVIGELGEAGAAEVKAPRSYAAASNRLMGAGMFVASPLMASPLSPRHRALCCRSAVVVKRRLVMVW